VAVSALKRFQASFNFPTQAEVQRLVQIADATLARRRRAGRLDPVESDRLLRMARIFDLATTTFDGDTAEARGWLSRPQRVLGGAVPEELATTEVGAQEVERALLRIEHGVFA
jgi:putative toxin-antitoxin system antitoxin component (TIGR02293 family)